jgi:hypothetical protein
MTLAQARSIEWSGWTRDDNDTCPACLRLQGAGHAPDCWLDADIMRLAAAEALEADNARRASRLDRIPRDA